MKEPAANPSCASQDLPISLAQERLWFLSRFAPGNPADHFSAAFRLTGPFQDRVLHQSLTEIMRRHEVLRIAFLSLSGRPAPRICPSPILDLRTFDLGNLSPPEREEKIRQMAIEQSRPPFDLANEVWRASLLRLGEAEHALLITFHQIAADFESLPVFSQELASLYESFLAKRPSPLMALALQYKDLAGSQRDWLESEAAKKQLAFWRERLAGLPCLLEFPIARPRPAAPSYRAAQHRVNLEKPVSDALLSLSQQEHCSLSAVLLAAFQALAGRYTGSADIAVGIPSANRTASGSKTLIGNFSNLLVLRTNLAGDPSFADLVRRVQTGVNEARVHGEFPFERLLEELKPPRHASYSPLVQVIFDFGEEVPPILRAGDLVISPLKVVGEFTRFDLMLSLQQTSRGVEGSFRYATDLFEAASIQRMAGHWKTILTEVLSRPGQRLSQLRLLTEVERTQLLVEWNDTCANFPEGKCLHELFEAQAEQSPEALAVLSEREQLSYRELNSRADRLAQHLRQLGVGPEVLVAICAERSVDMVIAMLATLKAGGAYVPLDPAYPAERLAFILQDAKAPVLLTQHRLKPRLPEHEATAVFLDDPALWAERALPAPKTGLPKKAKPENLAYVIYTSGSTGRPKGVAVEHRSPVAFVHWAQSVFSPAELAGVLASTSICFDLSVFEIFVPLSSGGKVILADNALHLSRLPAASQVTLINTVPSAITELVRTRSIPASVSTVNLAGEPLQTDLVQQIYRQGAVAKVYDLYGPSETTTYSTFALRSKNGPATIGRPIANTQVYLLDEFLQPVPLGVPGEIYLGGAGLARGYLNQPALTAEKFVPNPFAPPGSRLYRTGDIARYFPDGNLEFLGRKDNQVKIRGFRMELGEIETVLRQHSAVSAAAVMAREDIPGDKRLVAYVVAAELAPDSSSTAADHTLVPKLRAWLKSRLPDYMVPAIFVPLPALPLTPNGKVDRKALPPPEQVRPALKEALVQPRTPTEEMLGEIWREVLNLKQVGMQDDFFELGGHSLMMIQIISRVREAVQVDLSMRDFFATPTIAALAQLVEAILVREISQMSEEEAESLTESSPLLR